MKIHRIVLLVTLALFIIVEAEAKCNKNFMSDTLQTDSLIISETNDTDMSRKNETLNRKLEVMKFLNRKDREIFAENADFLRKIDASDVDSTQKADYEALLSILRVSDKLKEIEEQHHILLDLDKKREELKQQITESVKALGAYSNETVQSVKKRNIILSDEIIDFYKGVVTNIEKLRKKYPVSPAKKGRK